MSKLKVLTIIGTRPEIIRLSRVISKLDKYCKHIVVHTGQNYDYELNEIFFNDLGIRKPDFFLDAANNSSAKTIGNLIISADDVIKKVKPDAVLILGDTNSSLAGIPAKKRGIPIFHMEAGNRCFDQRVPEETNRIIIDHIADINMTYSTIARDYLLREGMDPDRVIKTGSPMDEVLEFYKCSISESEILKKQKLELHRYFVVSAHREENIDSDINFNKLIDILDFLSKNYRLPIVFSAHPRTKKRLDKSKRKLNPLIKIIKPLGFNDYLALQINSKAVLSDSGTITEESSILNFPALNIREAHERPEGMEEGAVMMTGLSVDRVSQCLTILKDQKRGKQRQLRKVKDYDAPNVSDKVLRIIHSYTDYINRVVWKKY
ncbi:MAG: UDP-N-acetylglucosamine 2-epimerase (non-hydrolyzing) [Gammaproteobacteria bacterium]|nr:UDP-N-acetylglucosamine 2-epimerase (non-hydrolyzing) [Gammaproteobacteria bacterium]